MPVDWVVVGLDNGGTTNNGTILDSEGRFLLDQMAEVPSNVRDGPDKAIQSLIDAVEQVLALTGVPLAAVRAIGLDTPGPASADGVISSKGATNFGDAGWGGFDIRGALASGCRSSTTTTGTRPRCTRTTCGSACSRRGTARCPRSWAPGSAAGWSRPGG